MATTIYSIGPNSGGTGHIHGSGVANCGSYPDIWANFLIYFDRDSGSSTVTWHTDGMGNWIHPTSGTYGYKLFVYLQVGGGDPQPIMIKDNTTGSSWWNHVSISDASGSFSTTGNEANVRILVMGKNSCQHSGQYCYRDVAFTEVFSQNYGLPEYQQFYTVDYNATGGSPTPQSQTKVSTETLTLSSITPVYPNTIKYYNEAGTTLLYTDTVYKSFLYWKCTADINTYQPGGAFNTNANCTMLANWQDATTTLRAIGQNNFKVIYEYNGGTGTPPSVLLPRAIVGYATTAGGSKVYNSGQSNVTVTNNLNLYPKYGNATLVYANLPVPSRKGYQFLGWYRESTFVNKITTNIDITADNTHIYAKWLALPLHKYTASGWSDTGPYVWWYDKTKSNQWDNKAPIRKFDGTNWVNISE